MRSRYSAFALGLPEYLLESWDAATRPVELELDPELSWRRLLVESAEAGGPLDREGWVTFTAIARGPSAASGTERIVQRERSRFTRSGADARWRYVDGAPLDPEI